MEQNPPELKTTTQVIRRGHEYGVHHFLASGSGSLIESISSALSLSHDLVAELVALGSVYLNHRRCGSHDEPLIQENDYLRVHTTPRRYPVTKHSFEDLIVENHPEFIVINKPSGIPVHPTVDNVKENLITHLSAHLGQDLYVTHRLDVVTEGLIVFAKTKSFQTLFNKLLVESQVRKVYRCLVPSHLMPESFAATKSIVHYMEPSPRAPKQVSSSPRDGWAKCSLKITHRSVVSSEFTELKIHLETGRTHQIRSQLAAEGCPIIGDRMYGSTFDYGSGAEKIALQSCELSFLETHAFQLPSPWDSNLRR